MPATRLPAAVRLPEKEQRSTDPASMRLTMPPAAAQFAAPSIVSLAVDWTVPSTVLLEICPAVSRPTSPPRYSAGEVTLPEKRHPSTRPSSISPTRAPLSGVSKDRG